MVSSPLLRCPISRPSRPTVAAAFAQERDAHYAVQVITSAIEDRVDYTLRHVMGEDGLVQLVILEATFDDPSLEARIVTVMAGTHGVIVPPYAG
jgi:hypothetical protein